uniref:Nuclear pore complex protein Nup214 n=1 Tax=Mesocestoides corti TaxID=53468 RepID=A0A5K3F1F8_MESCO
MMGSFSTTEFHFLPFESNNIEIRSCLLAASCNGIVFVSRCNDLAVFSANDYSQASLHFSQRKDKPLTSFQPNFSIPFPRPILWLAANCTGGLLLVCSQSQDGASLLQLINIQNMSAQPPYGFIGDPLNLSTPQGGAEQGLPPTANAVIDLAWNPADPYMFALVTKSGSVRLFTANPQHGQPLSLIGTMPNSMQVRCLSWSPKGKQLAVSSVGVIPGVSQMNTTAIVQVDHDLKIKRVIPLATPLTAIHSYADPRPIDILWSSTYCFLLALESADPGRGTCLTFLCALPKVEPRLTQLEDFAGAGAPPFQYNMRLLPNSGSVVAITWSAGGEDCLLLDVPAVSTAAGSPPVESLPKVIKELPLPSDRPPVALDIGALTNSSEPLPLMVGRHMDGAVFAFQLQPTGSSPTDAIFSGFRLWCASAEKPPRLPPPANAVPAAVVTTTTASKSNLPSTNSAPSASGFGNFFAPPPSLPVSAGSAPAAAATTTPSTSILSGLLSTPVTNDALFTTATTKPSLTGSSLFGTLSAQSTSNTGTNSFSGFSYGQKAQTSASPQASGAVSSPPKSSTAVEKGVTLEEKKKEEAPTAVEHGDTSKTPSTAISTSIMDAAAQFSKALESQAAASARAWDRLWDVFDGDTQNLRCQDGPEGTALRRGVRDIEQSLVNMDSFLDVVKEITNQLSKASQLSMNDQKDSSDYVERLNADFEAYNNNFLTERVSARLDPEAAGMLSSLKKKFRAAEGFLGELEEQIESLTTQLEAHSERSRAARSKIATSPGHASFSSPFEKIRASIAVNAHLIKSERKRLDLISRMSGISLNDALGPTSTKPSDKPSLCLGGSVVSPDREQRDADLFRMLTSGDNNFSDASIPVARAAKTVADLVESMRAEFGKKGDEAAAEEEEERSVLVVQPRAVASKTPEQALSGQKPTTPPSAVSPQVNTPGKQKNQEISRLLASAASVPPVTLSSDSLPRREASPRSTTAGPAFSTSTQRDLRTSTPFPKDLEESTPVKPLKDSFVARHRIQFNGEGDVAKEKSSGSQAIGSADATKSSLPKQPTSVTPSQSKSPIFVPSPSKCLTSPTRVPPIAAPTTKVLGAPNNSSVEGFRPVPARIPSPCSKPSDPTGASIFAAAFPPPSTVQAAEPSSPFASIFATATAASSPPSPKPESPPIASTGSVPALTISTPTTTIAEPPSTLQTKTTTTEGPTKPIYGGLFGPAPGGIFANLLASSTTTTTSTANSNNLSPTSVATASIPPAPSVTSSAEPIQRSTMPAGDTFVAKAPPSEAVAAEKSVPPSPSMTSTSTTSDVAPSASVFGQPSLRLFGQPTATTAGQSSTLFGQSPTTTAGQAASLFGQSPATTSGQSAKLFGQSPPTTAGQVSTLFGQSPVTNAGQTFTLFGQPQTTTSGQTSSLFGQSSVTTAGQTSMLFGQSPATTAGQTPSLFGQSPATTAGQALTLFGQPLATTAGQTPTLFGQPLATTAGQTPTLFGQSPATTTSQPPSLFGQSPVTTASQASTLFGQSLATTAGQPPSLFGQSSTTTAGQASPVFGQSPATTVGQTSTLFGQPPASTASQSGDLFGML